MKELDVRRMVAQSFAGWPHARVGGPVKTEDDPLDPDPPEAVRRALEAILYLERAVLRTDGVEGTVLRHGGFYGPGTSLGEGGFQLEGTGVDASHRRWRHRGVVVIHIDDAASATLAAIERANPGLYNIVDDEPAPVAEWLPALAEAIREPSLPGESLCGWLAYSRENTG
jgi:nucleoside-diphosphate-sugar epimerase